MTPATADDDDDDNGTGSGQGDDFDDASRSRPTMSRGSKLTVSARPINELSITEHDTAPNTNSSSDQAYNAQFGTTSRPTSVQRRQPVSEPVSKSTSVVPMTLTIAQGTTTTTVVTAPTGVSTAASAGPLPSVLPGNVTTSPAPNYAGASSTLVSSSSGLSSGHLSSTLVQSPSDISTRMGHPFATPHPKATGLQHSSSGLSQRHSHSQLQPGELPMKLHINTDFADKSELQDVYAASHASHGHDSEEDEEDDVPIADMLRAPPTEGDRDADDLITDHDFSIPDATGLTPRHKGASTDSNESSRANTVFLFSLMDHVASPAHSAGGKRPTLANSQLDGQALSESTSKVPMSMTPTGTRLSGEFTFPHSPAHRKVGSSNSVVRPPTEPTSISGSTVVMASLPTEALAGSTNGKRKSASSVLPAIPPRHTPKSLTTNESVLPKSDLDQPPKSRPEGEEAAAQGSMHQPDRQNTMALEPRPFSARAASRPPQGSPVVARSAANTPEPGKPRVPPRPMLSTQRSSESSDYHDFTSRSNSAGRPVAGATLAQPGEPSEPSLSIEPPVPYRRTSSNQAPSKDITSQEDAISRVRQVSAEQSVTLPKALLDVIQQQAGLIPPDSSPLVERDSQGSSVQTQRGSQTGPSSRRSVTRYPGQSLVSHITIDSDSVEFETDSTHRGPNALSTAVELSSPKFLSAAKTSAPASLAAPSATPSVAPSVAPSAAPTPASTTVMQIPQGAAWYAPAVPPRIPSSKVQSAPQQAHPVEAQNQAPAGTPDRQSRRLSSDLSLVKSVYDDNAQDDQPESSFVPPPTLAPRSSLKLQIDAVPRRQQSGVVLGEAPAEISVKNLSHLLSPAELHIPVESGAEGNISAFWHVHAHALGISSRMHSLTSAAPESNQEASNHNVVKDVADKSLREILSSMQLKSGYPDVQSSHLAHPPNSASVDATGSTELSSPGLPANSPPKPWAWSRAKLLAEGPFACGGILNGQDDDDYEFNQLSRTDRESLANWLRSIGGILWQIATHSTGIPEVDQFNDDERSTAPRPAEPSRGDDEDAEDSDEDYDEEALVSEESTYLDTEADSALTDLDNEPEALSNELMLLTASSYPQTSADHIRQMLAQLDVRRPILGHALSVPPPRPDSYNTVTAQQSQIPIVVFGSSRKPRRVTRRLAERLRRGDTVTSPSDSDDFILTYRCVSRLVGAELGWYLHRWRAYMANANPAKDGPDAFEEDALKLLREKMERRWEGFLPGSNLRTAHMALTNFVYSTLRRRCVREDDPSAAPAIGVPKSVFDDVYVPYLRESLFSFNPKASTYLLLRAKYQNTSVLSAALRTESDVRSLRLDSDAESTTGLPLFDPAPSLPSNALAVMKSRVPQLSARALIMISIRQKIRAEIDAYTLALRTAQRKLLNQSNPIARDQPKP